MSNQTYTANQALKLTFKRLNEDPRVGIADNDEAFIAAAKSGLSYAIYHRAQKPDISKTLEEFGYREISRLYRNGTVIKVNFEGNQPVITMPTLFPDDIQKILIDRARLFASITGKERINLKFCSPSVKKYHPHIGPVMTGALLDRGTEWLKPDGSAGKVEKGDDFFIAPWQMHRTPVHEPGETPADPVRAIWILETEPDLRL